MDPALWGSTQQHLKRRPKISHDSGSTRQRKTIIGSTRLCARRIPSQILITTRDKAFARDATRRQPDALMFQQRVCVFTQPPVRSQLIRFDGFDCKKRSSAGDCAAVRSSPGEEGVVPWGGGRPVVV